MKSAVEYVLDRFGQIDVLVNGAAIPSSKKRGNDEVRSEYKEKVTDLRNERKELKQRVDQLREAGSEEFKEMRTAVAEDVAALGADIEEVTHEIQQSLRPKTVERG